MKKKTSKSISRILAGILAIAIFTSTNGSFLVWGMSEGRLGFSGEPMVANAITVDEITGEQVAPEAYVIDREIGFLESLWIGINSIFGNDLKTGILGDLKQPKKTETTSYAQMKFMINNDCWSPSECEQINKDARDDKLKKENEKIFRVAMADYVARSAIIESEERYKNAVITLEDIKIKSNNLPNDKFFAISHISATRDLEEAKLDLANLKNARDLMVKERLGLEKLSFFESRRVKKLAIKASDVMIAGQDGFVASFAITHLKYEEPLDVQIAKDDVWYAADRAASKVVYDIVSPGESNSRIGGIFKEGGGLVSDLVGAVKGDDLNYAGYEYPEEEKLLDKILESKKIYLLSDRRSSEKLERVVYEENVKSALEDKADKSTSSEVSDDILMDHYEKENIKQFTKEALERRSIGAYKEGDDILIEDYYSKMDKRPYEAIRKINILGEEEEEESYGNGDLSDYYKSDAANSALQARNLRAIEEEKGWIATAWDNTFGSWFGGSDKQLNNEELRATAGIRAVGPVDTNTGTNWRRVTANLMEQDGIKGKYGGLSEYMDCESNNCDPIIVTVADSSFAGIDELQHYGAQIEAAYDFNYAGELEAQLRGDSFGDGVEIAQNRHGTIVVAKILSDFAVNGIDTRRVKLKLVSVNLNDSFGYLESALDHAEGSDIFHSSTGWGTNIKVHQAVAKIQANNGPEQERWSRTLNKIETLSKNGTIVSVSAMNSALEDAPLYGSNRSGTVGMSALSSEYAIHWGAVDAYGLLEDFSKSGKDGSHSTFYGENRLVDIPGEGEDGVEGAIIAYASQSAERASILAANEYSAKHQLSIDNEAVLSVSKKAYDDSYKANINDRHLREKMTELAVMGQGTSYAHQLGGFIVEKDKLKAELAAAGNDGEIITASDIVTRVRESVAKNPDVYPGILLGHRESTGRFREALSDSFIDNMEEDKAKATEAFVSTSGMSTDLASIYIDNIYKYISDPDGALVQLSDFREELFKEGVITSRDQRITEEELALITDKKSLGLIGMIVEDGKLANLMNIARDELDVPASRKITDAEYSRRLIAEEEGLGLMNTTDDSSWVENLNPFNWFSSNVDSDEEKTNQEKMAEMERSRIVAWNNALGDEFGEIESMKDTDGNTMYLASTGNINNGIQTNTKVVDVASAAISLYDELVYNPGVYEINSSDVEDVVKEMDKRISKSVNKEIVDGVTNYYDGSRLVYSIEKNGDSVIVKDWQIEVNKNSDTIKSAAVLTQAVAGILGASELAKIASVVQIEGDNTVGIIDSVVEWIPFVGKLITKNTDQALKERFLAAASKVGGGEFTEAYNKITEGGDWDEQKVNWENNLTVTGVAVDIFEGAKIGRALELITPDEFKNATVEALLSIEGGDDVGVVFNEFTSRTGSARVELAGSVKEKIKDDPIVFFAKLAQQSGNTEAQLVTEAMLIAKAVYGDVTTLNVDKAHEEIEKKSVIVFNENTRNALSGKDLDVHFLERGYSIIRNPQDGTKESESLRFLKNNKGEIIGRIAPDKSGQDVVFYYKDRQLSTTEKSLGHIKRVASLLGKAGIVDRELANTVALGIEFAGKRDNVETVLRNREVDGIAGLISKYGNSEIKEVATIYIDGKKLIGNSSRLLDDINAAIEKSESSKGWFDKLFNKSGGDVEILNTVMSEETLKDLKIALENKNQIVKIKNGEIQAEDVSGEILVIKDKSFEVINGSGVVEDKVTANIKDESVVQQSNFENKDLSKMTSLWEQAEYAYEKGQIKKDAYEDLLKTSNEFYLDQDKEYSYNTETRTYDECGFFGRMFNGSCQTGNNYKSAKGVIIKSGNREDDSSMDIKKIPQITASGKKILYGTDDNVVRLTTADDKEKIKYYLEDDVLDDDMGDDGDSNSNGDKWGVNESGYGTDTYDEDYGVEQGVSIKSEQLDKNDVGLSDSERLNQALRDRDVADLADSNLQASNLRAIKEGGWVERTWSAIFGSDEEIDREVEALDSYYGSDQEGAVEDSDFLLVEDAVDGVSPYDTIDGSLLGKIDLTTQGANAPPEDGSGFDPDFVENVLAAGIQSAGNRVLLMVSQGGNSPEAIANVYLEEIGKKALSATGKALFGDNPLTTVASKLTSIFAFGDVEDSVKAVDRAAGVDLLGSGSQGGSFDSVNDFLQSGYGSDIMSAAVSAVKTGDVEGAGKALLSSMAGRYVENVATEYITTGTVDLISTFKPADDLAEGLFGGASSTVAAGAAAAASTLVGQLIMNGKVDLEAVGVVAAKSAATHAITKSLTGTTVGKVLGSTMGAVGGAVVNLVYAAVTGELNVETVVTSVASIATTIVMTQVVTSAIVTAAATAAAATAAAAASAAAIAAGATAAAAAAAGAAAGATAGGAAGAAAGTLAGGLTVGGPVGVVVAAVVMIIQGIFRNLSDDPSANELREYAKITQEVFNPSFDFEGLKDGSNEKIIAAVASGDRARVSGAIREAINKSAIGKFSHVVGVSGIVNTIVAIFEDKADRIYGVKRNVEFSEIENFTSTEDASMDLLTRRFIKLKQDLRICYLADNQDCVTDVASKILDLRQLLASRSIEVFSARISSLNKRIGALTRELNRIEHTLFGEEKRIAKERAEKELERLRMERGELQDASDTAGGLILECKDGTIPYLGWCMTPERRDEMKCTFGGGTYMGPGDGGFYRGIPGCNDFGYRTEGGEGESGGEGGAGGE